MRKNRQNVGNGALQLFRFVTRCRMQSRQNVVVYEGSTRTARRSTDGGELMNDLTAATLIRQHALHTLCLALYSPETSDQIASQSVGDWPTI